MKNFIGLSVAGFFGAALSACAAVSVKAPIPYRAATVAEAKAHAAKELYSPSCPSHGPLADDRCGTLMQKISKEERSDFREAACEKVSAPACDAKFADMMAARWAVRYPLANASAIQAWCAKDQDECENLTLLELQWMDSHNETVLSLHHLTKMDMQLHSQRIYARVRREQRELGLLGNSHARAAAQAADAKQAENEESTSALEADSQSAGMLITSN